VKKKEKRKKKKVNDKLKGFIEPMTSKK